ncbi:MAG TPA: hypothetical protein VHE37_10790 [Nevskiaceae bacterium]|nr:hypothetical protein [Nevskiaceae bacterium]
MNEIHLARRVLSEANSEYRELLTQFDIFRAAAAKGLESLRFGTSDLSIDQLSPSAFEIAFIGRKFRISLRTRLENNVLKGIVECAEVRDELGDPATSFELRSDGGTNVKVKIPGWEGRCYFVNDYETASHLLISLLVDALKNTG